MKSMSSLITPGPIILLALPALAWAIIAVTLASLAPIAYVPRIFNSTHVEHLAAFYIVTLVGAAAFGRLSLLRLAGLIVTFAVALAAIRVFQAAHRASALEDLLCDTAGVWTAIAPIIVARFRNARSPAEIEKPIWRH
jgi:hypothetical protein